MKRLGVAVALLVLLLVGSLANAWKVQSLTDDLNQRLRLAQELAQGDQWDRAEELTRDAYALWQGEGFYLHALLRHGDTDEILCDFREVLQYVELEEMDQYGAANVELMTRIELLAEMERASWVNVL